MRFQLLRQGSDIPLPFGINRYSTFSQNRLATSGCLRRGIRAVNPGKELVERLDIPPAIHVGFANADTPVRKYSLVHPGIVDLNIPFASAIDTDVDVGKKFGYRWATLARYTSRNTS